MTVAIYTLLPYLLATYRLLIRLRPAWLSVLLLCVTWCVIITLTAQGTSSFFSTNASEGTATSGLALIKASLIIQLFLNASFIIALSVFYRRCKFSGIFQQRDGRSLQIVLVTLCVCITLVVIRNLFRSAQIFLPSGSTAWTTQAFFWVFEAVPMLAYMAILNIMHPGRYLGAGIVAGACGAKKQCRNIDELEQWAGRQEDGAGDEQSNNTRTT